MPYQNSELMAEAFKKHGVKHELVSIPDAEHGLTGGDPKLIDAAYEKASEFLAARLKP